MTTGIVGTILHANGNSATVMLAGHRHVVQETKENPVPLPVRCTRALVHKYYELMKPTISDQIYKCIRSLLMTPVRMP